MTTVDWIHKMREANLSQEQAEAIASGYEDRYVTREYLDARLAQLESRFEVRFGAIEARFGTTDAKISSAINDLTWRMLGIVGLAIVIVGLLDKFVRP